MTSQTILGIMFAVLGSLVVIGLLLYNSVLKKLRRDHNGTWESLGSPSLFLNNSLVNSARVLGFVFMRKHRSLKDGTLSSICDFLLVYYLIFSAYFVVYIYLFFKLQLER